MVPDSWEKFSILTAAIKTTQKEQVNTQFPLVKKKLTALTG